VVAVAALVAFAIPVRRRYERAEVVELQPALEEAA
jgi:hypothetical protein